MSPAAVPGARQITPLGNVASAEHETLENGAIEPSAVTVVQLGSEGLVVVVISSTEVLVLLVPAARQNDAVGHDRLSGKPMPVGLLNGVFHEVASVGVAETA